MVCILSAFKNIGNGYSVYIFLKHDFTVCKTICVINGGKIFKINAFEHIVNGYSFFKSVQYNFCAKLFVLNTMAWLSFLFESSFTNV